MADEQPLEEPGVFANGRFYRHTRHFLQVRDAKHPEASDVRIRRVLEEPEHIEEPEGNRYVCWRRIREPGTDEWWMKVVVVENPSGPAILSAYHPAESE